MSQYQAGFARSPILESMTCAEFMLLGLKAGCRRLKSADCSQRLIVYSSASLLFPSCQSTVAGHWEVAVAAVTLLDNLYYYRSERS